MNLVGILKAESSCAAPSFPKLGHTHTRTHQPEASGVYSSHRSAELRARGSHLQQLEQGAPQNALFHSEALFAAAPLRLQRPRAFLPPPLPLHQEQIRSAYTRGTPASQAAFFVQPHRSL